MRFRHPDGTTVHLAYCTNVHPAEDLAGVHRQLEVYGAAVRARLGVPSLSLGLWLPAPLARNLARNAADLSALRGELARHGLETVTLNAFPYRGFHAPVVKQAVYHPDWTQEDRLAYTLDCARVLAALLPDDAARGSVSTVPLAWRTPWDPASAARARLQLDRLADGLAKIEAETGRTIRVAFEPEPGCVVETTEQAARQLSGVDTHRLGVCLDLCHLAVAFENPDRAIGNLAGAGLPIVKAQVSAALEAADPADPATAAALSRYTEERFLHQVRDASGGSTDDLPEALDSLPTGSPWRVHFHAPLHRRPEPPLTSTTGHLRSTLTTLLGGPRALTDHLEVETYTWSVLPEHHRPTTEAELADGLAAELNWTAQALHEVGVVDR
ncbi:metabolite traffic protein EboE [Streptomyces xiamenensis]|uniref:metabolite traffic protein EboE n=1 Tax=Streptomyces xiamenensis TaxID=408015 RepID=UPI0035D939A3